MFTMHIFQKHYKISNWCWEFIQSRENNGCTNPFNSTPQKNPPQMRHIYYFVFEQPLVHVLFFLSAVNVVLAVERGTLRLREIEKERSRIKCGNVVQVNFNQMVKLNCTCEWFDWALTLDATIILRNLLKNKSLSLFNIKICYYSPTIWLIHMVKFSTT
jgi:hypothetical protein